MCIIITASPLQDLYIGDVKEYIKKAFSDAQGCSKTGSKKDGWSDVPPHHVHKDGHILSVGAHTH